MKKIDIKIFLFLLPVFLFFIFSPTQGLVVQAQEKYELESVHHVDICVPKESVQYITPPSTKGEEIYCYNFGKSDCNKYSPVCYYQEDIKIIVKSTLESGAVNFLNANYNLCKNQKQTGTLVDCYSFSAEDCPSSDSPFSCRTVKVEAFEYKKIPSSASASGSGGTTQTPFPILKDPLNLSGNAETAPQMLIGRIINYIMGIIGSLALVMFIYGGIMWMTAGGKADQVKKSTGIIVWAVLGMAAVFLSYILVKILIENVAIIS